MPGDWVRWLPSYLQLGPHPSDCIPPPRPMIELIGIIWLYCIFDWVLTFGIGSAAVPADLAHWFYSVASHLWLGSVPSCRVLSLWNGDWVRWGVYASWIGFPYFRLGSVAVPGD